MWFLALPLNRRNTVKGIFKHKKTIVASPCTVLLALTEMLMSHCERSGTILFISLMKGFQLKPEVYEKYESKEFRQMEGIHMGKLLPSNSQIKAG